MTFSAPFAALRNRRCARRLQRAERLLWWVQDECDLSGQMELAADIRAFLEEI